MALFGGSKTTDGPGEGEKTEFSPERAVKFFEHARTVHETGNYEYGAQLWLSGLRHNPLSLEGLAGFFGSMASFLAETGKKSVSKEVAKVASGRSELDKFLGAILEWGQKPEDSVLAVRAVEAAAAAKLAEPCIWIAERAYAKVIRDKKPRKDLLEKLSEALEKVGAFDQAVSAAEAALKLDQTDGPLAARLRSLAAMATMNRGGYDQTGQQGGFRANIRDAEKQKHLEEADRVVKTEETVDRLIASAEADLANRPGDLPTIDKLGKLLMERGRPADEERARSLYMKAWEEGRQFRFRELAGDIDIRRKRRMVSELRKMAEQAPDDEDVRSMLESNQSDLIALEVAEYKLRVEHYPSDLARKFELGRRYYAAGDMENAIACLQEAQSDPKSRVSAQLFLGQAFLKMEYADEAIETFRAASQNKDVLPEVSMELRYWLMCALQAKAVSARDLASGEEAEKIAASIFAQSIGYKDIRARRDAIKKLVAELRAAR